MRIFLFSQSNFIALYLFAHFIPKKLINNVKEFESKQWDGQRIPFIKLPLLSITLSA